MTTGILIVGLMLAQSEAPVSDRQFSEIGRQWLSEMIVEPSRSCVNSAEDRVSFRAAINELGEIKIVFLSASSEQVKQCVQFIAQPVANFSKEARAVEVTVGLPVRDSYEEIPVRSPKEPGNSCTQHVHCGAGQGCFRAELKSGQDAGATQRRGRCLDLQRWLTGGGAKAAGH